MKQVSGSASGAEEVSEMNEGRVAPEIVQGGVPDFIRKRKRAYHRAYESGHFHRQVVDFQTKCAISSMMNSIADALFMRRTESSD